jgi:hypothetical protein
MFGVVLFVIHNDHWGVLSMPFFSSNVVAKPLIITLSFGDALTIQI